MLFLPISLKCSKSLLFNVMCRFPFFLFAVVVKIYISSSLSPRVAGRTAFVIYIRPITLLVIFPLLTTVTSTIPFANIVNVFASFPLKNNVFLLFLLLFFISSSLSATVTAVARFSYFTLLHLFSIHQMHLVFLPQLLCPAFLTDLQFFCLFLYRCLSIVVIVYIYSVFSHIFFTLPAVPFLSFTVIELYYGHTVISILFSVKPYFCGNCIKIGLFFTVLPYNITKRK